MSRGRPVVIHVADLVRWFDAKRAVWVRTAWNNSYAIALSGCKRTALDYKYKRVQYIELGGHCLIETDEYLRNIAIEALEK